MNAVHMVTYESFRQLLRFGIAGAGLTLLVSVLYLIALEFTVFSPALALTIATLLASIAGYFVHSSFSFRGFGMRDRPTMRFVRFLINNGVGYLLNLAFVFAMVDFAHLPEWTPIIAFCAITPLVSFMLNRHWVFG